MNPDYLPEQPRDAYGFPVYSETVYLVEFSLGEFLTHRPGGKLERRDALILSRVPLVPMGERADAYKRGEHPETYAGPEVFRVIALWNKRVEMPEFDTARAALRHAVRADALGLTPQ